MVKLVPFGLPLADRPTRRTRFKSIQLLRVFCYKGIWYQKKSSRTARRADCDDLKPEFFGKDIMVNVLTDEPDDSVTTGQTYEEFMAQQLL